MRYLKANKITPFHYYISAKAFTPAVKTVLDFRSRTEHEEYDRPSSQAEV